MTRHITAVCTPGEGGYLYAVGRRGPGGIGTVTEITETTRYGQMAMVPWFDVSLDTGSIIEVNAAHVEYVEWSDHA